MDEMLERINAFVAPKDYAAFVERKKPEEQPSFPFFNPDSFRNNYSTEPKESDELGSPFFNIAPADYADFSRLLREDIVVNGVLAPVYRKVNTEAHDDIIKKYQGFINTARPDNIIVDKNYLSSYKKSEALKSHFTSQEFLEQKFEEYCKNSTFEVKDMTKQEFFRTIVKYFNYQSDNLLTTDFVLHTLGYKNSIDYFADYLTSKLGDISAARILDLGAGYNCRLARKLASMGCKEVFALDNNISYSDEECKKLGITPIRKYISMDDDPKYLDDYDFVVANYPCGATEILIRQALERDKDIAIALCGEPHEAISPRRQIFASAFEWYNHLHSIDRDKLDLDFEFQDGPKVNAGFYISTMPGFNKNITKEQ